MDTGRCRRLPFFVMAVVLMLVSVGVYLPEPDGMEVAAAENSVSMEVIMSRFPIAVVGRSASHALRRIRVSGAVVFCLDTDKHMDTGDQAEVSVCYAPNYSNKKVAKALTYYFGDSGKTNMDFALVQAYLWAVEQNKGKSDRITAVYQGGKNYSSSYTRTKAEKLVDRIEDTTPRGTVYRYRINSCRADLSISAHQPLITLKNVPPEPVTKSVTKSLEEIPEEDISVSISKIDEESGKKIDGETTFLLTCSDGYRKELTVNGSRTVTYTRELSKIKVTSEKFYYVSNWNKLESYQKSALTDKGYYSSKAKAESAAKKDAAKKLDTAVEKALGKGKYTWMLTEVRPPAGYGRSADTLTLTENKSHKSISFTAKDRKIHGRLRIIKRPDESYEGEAVDFQGTQYALFTAEGAYVESLTIGADNTAVTSELTQGQYLLRETCALPGWKLDETEYPIDLVNTGATETFVQEKTVYDEETETPEGPLVKVLKKKEKDGAQTAEKEALFAVFDMDRLEGDAGQIIRQADSENSAQRQAFLDAHKNTLLGTMVTDAEGRASLRIPVEAMDPEDRGVLILQIRSESGYSLCAPAVRTFEIAEEPAAEAEEKQEQTEEQPESIDAEVVEEPEPVVTEALKASESTETEALEEPEPAETEALKESEQEEDAKTSEKPEQEKESEKPEKEKETETPEKAKTVKKSAAAVNYREIEVSYEAVDEFTDYGQIRIHKTKDMGPGEDCGVINEAEAVFQVLDEKLEEVCRLTTDGQGVAETGQLPFGTYLIRQLSGSGIHELHEDVYVTIDETNRMVTQELTLENHPKETTFVLNKNCAETGVALNGAAFALYDAAGQLITTMVTDELGIAEITLPYGEYSLQEVVAPEGYVPDETVESFVLNAKSVDYDETGHGSCEAIIEDAPIYGEIRALKYATVPVDSEKLGTGDETKEQEAHKTGRFLYGEEPLAGVELGLFAGEEIKDAGGRTVYQKDDPVDTQITNEKGEVHFERLLENGGKTHDLYLGTYYVRELSAPEGFVMSDRSETVRITADKTAETVNVIEDTNPFDDYFSEAVYQPDGGRYVLCEGERFRENAIITNASRIRFLFRIPGTVARGDCIDVSADGDGTILMWEDGAGTVCIAPAVAEHVIRFNRVSSHMFENCSNLTDIELTNIDTSLTVDMSYLFAGCEKLRELDLTAFNTLNVMNCAHMFAGCSRLERIYTVETDLERTEWQMPESPVKIVALPLNTFIQGDEIRFDDFWYTLYWDEDGDRSSYEREEELRITSADIASISGTTERDGTVEIRLSDGGENRDLFARVFRTNDVDAWVLSADIKVEGETDMALQFDYHPEAIAKLYNDAVQVEYNIHKNDTKGKPLAGAVFGLFAACNIYSFDGINALRAGKSVPESELLYKKGALITTAATGEDGEILITGLANRTFAQPDSEYMYYIREMEAPKGYKLNEERQYFTGEPGGEQQALVLSDATFIDDFDSPPPGPKLTMPATGVNDGRNLALIRLLFVVILLITVIISKRGKIREKMADIIKHRT